MRQFNELSHSALIDLLAKQTALYTQMLSDNIKTNEFYKCKRLLEQLATEVEFRMKEKPSENPATDTPVSLRHE